MICVLEFDGKPSRVGVMIRGLRPIGGTGVDLRGASVVSQPVIEYGHPAQWREIISRTWRRLQRYVVAALIFMLIYVGSYLILSVNGHFAPGATGTNGIKWLEWVPAGFSEGFRRRRPVYWSYLPLWVLDQRMWHVEDGSARSLSYPVRIPKTAAEWAEFRS
jgi:hypothetical protein